jgi:hypothetical protein
VGSQRSTTGLAARGVLPGFAALRPIAGATLPWLVAVAVIGVIYFSPKHVMSAQTAVTVLLALGIVALAARQPDRSLIVLIVLMPFQGFLLAWLWRIGMPSSVVRHLGDWKELLVIAVVVAGVRNYLAAGHHADVLDRLALGFVALGTIYLAIQHAIVLSAPSSFNVRLLGFRQDILFVLLAWAARHAPFPDDLLRRVGRAVLLAAAVVAGVAAFEELDSSGWNHFVVHTIQYTRYQVGILHSTPPNYSDIRTYGTVGGTRILRAGSVFLSPLTTGFYLVLGFAVALERAARRQATPWVMLTLIFCGAGILLTQTRSAILAALVVLMVAFGPAAGRAAGWRTRLGILVVALAILAVPAALSTGLSKRITSTTANNSDTSGHISDQLSGLRTIEQHPLGLGLGTSAGTGQRFQSQGSEVVVPEDGYLQVGIELGMLPMMLFLALTIALLLSLRKASRRRPEALVAGAWEAAAGLAVATFFLQTWVDFSVAWTFWGVAGAALGLSRIAVPEQAPAAVAAGLEAAGPDESRQQALV